MNNKYEQRKAAAKISVERIENHFDVALQDVLNDHSTDTRSKMKTIKHRLYKAVANKFSLEEDVVKKELKNFIEDTDENAPVSVPVLWGTIDLIYNLEQASGPTIVDAVQKLHDGLSNVAQQKTGAAVGAGLAGLGLMGIGLGLLSPALVFTGATATMSISAALTVTITSMTVALFGALILAIVLVVLGLIILFFSLASHDYYMHGLIMNKTNIDLNIAGYPLGNDMQDGYGLYFEPYGLIYCMNGVTTDNKQLNLPGMEFVNVQNVPTESVP